jgi:hypothetical protein
MKSLIHAGVHLETGNLVYDVQTNRNEGKCTQATEMKANTFTVLRLWQQHISMNVKLYNVTNILFV